MKPILQKLGLLVVMLLAVLSASAAVNIDGIYYSLDSDGTATVTNSKDGSSSYTPKDYSSDIVIPNEVNYNGKTYTVDEIDGYAFKGCTGLTSVTFPESLTFIGEYAFYGCTGLTSLTFPEALTSICEQSFYSCSGLRTLEFHCNTIQIGESAFASCGYFYNVTFDCKSIEFSYHYYNDIHKGYYCDPFGGLKDSPCIKTLILGSSVLSISKTASPTYYLCATKTMWLGNTPPKGKEYISNKINYVSNESFGFKDQKIYPFLSSKFTVDGTIYVPVNPSERTCDVIDCTYEPAMTKIVIAYKVVNRGIELTINEINPYSFYRNDCITDVKLSNNGSIGEYAFAYCSSIANADIRATGIGEHTFYESAQNDAAKFSIETGSIGSDAFANCSSITHADIRATSIGYNGFYNCEKLESATLAEGLTEIGGSAFRYSGLKSIVIPNSVTELGGSVFSGCSSLESVTIGAGVTDLPQYTFKDCSSLPEINIPENVATIGDNVFSGCKSLAKVNIADRQTELALGSNGSSPLFADCPLDEVYIGGDISYPTASDEGYSPFYRNTSLRSVTITDKETEISLNEFYGCTNLQEVVIGDGVEKIGDYAFSGCSSLKSFAFGSKVKTIGEEAFSDCTAMTSLTSHNPVPPECGPQALDDINKWDCTLYVPQESTDSYKAAPQWKEFFFIENWSGIEDATLDDNAPAEYFNLQGVRVANPQNGIFIKRQGSKISKVAL